MLIHTLLIIDSKELYKHDKFLHLYSVKSLTIYTFLKINLSLFKGREGGWDSSLNNASDCFSSLSYGARGPEENHFSG